MFRYLRAAFLALAGAVALSACAPMHYKGLAPDDAGKIREVDLRAVVAQESFSFSAAAPGISAAAGGGLIPALIDSSVQASRQAALAPELARFYDAFYDTDFRFEAGGALTDAAQSFTFKVARAEMSPLTLTKAEQDAAVAATARGPAYLRLWIYYSIDSTLSVFTVRTAAALWQDGKAAESYKNHLIYQSRLPEGTREEKLRRLAVDSAALMRAEMRKAGGHLRRMLAYDLAQPAPAGPPAPPKDSTTLYVGSTPVKVAVTRISEQDDMVMWRDASGSLFTTSR